MTSQAYLFLLLGPFILAAAYQTQTSWLYLIGAADFALLVTGWAGAWWNARGLRVSCLPIAPVTQGTPARLRLRLTRDRAGTSYDVQVFLPPKRPSRWLRFWRSALLPPGWGVASAGEVSAERPADLSLELPTPRRGEFAMPTVYLQSAFPLGLVALLRPQALEGTYLVYPQAEPIVSLPWIGAAGAAAPAASQALESGAGMLLRGVREYRPGDAWRQIHWRTMARRGEPHVRETDVERADAAVLYLDLRASVHTEASLEHLITIAASLLAHCRATGRPLELAMAPEAMPQGPWPHGDRALAMLARLEANALEGPLAPPPRAIVLSPAYWPSWRASAGHFIYCPAEPDGARDATVYCPLGTPVGQALSARKAA